LNLQNSTADNVLYTLDPFFNQNQFKFAIIPWTN
jgi:hypothetical protein